MKKSTLALSALAGALALAGCSKEAPKASGAIMSRTAAATALRHE